MRFVETNPGVPAQCALGAGAIENPMSAKAKRAWGVPDLGLFYCALALIFLTTSCATPIGVNYVDPSIGYQSLTANILSEDKPSSFSARELMNLNLYQSYPGRSREGPCRHARRI